MTRPADEIHGSMGDASDRRARQPVDTLCGDPMRVTVAIRSEERRGEQYATAWHSRMRWEEHGGVWIRQADVAVKVLDEVTLDEARRDIARWSGPGTRSA